MTSHIGQQLIYLKVEKCVISDLKQSETNNIEINKCNKRDLILFKSVLFGFSIISFEQHSTLSECVQKIKSTILLLLFSPIKAE